MMTTLLRLLVIVALTNAVVVRQHVHKSASRRVQLIKEGKLGDFLAEQEKQLDSKAATGAQPFTHYLDELYTGELSLGTPYQNLTVTIETASADTWVIDAQRCNSNACKGEGGYTKTRFSTWDSSTMHNTTFAFSESTRAGEIAARGYVITDVLNLAGLVSSKQGLGVASAISDAFGMKPVDGVFGLAWPNLSEVSPPMQQLLDQLDLPIFTMWLDRSVKPEENKVGGLITYGGFDKEHCNPDVNYVVLSSLAYWQFPMTRFSIGSYSSNARQDMIVDSGYAWFGAPASAVAGIVSATGAKYDSFNQMYTLPCTGKYPDMVFTIGGTEFTVKPSTYVLDLHLGKGNCALAVNEIKANGFNAQWTLGNVWLKEYCNIHDIGQKRIGFAKAF